MVLLSERKSRLVGYIEPCLPSPAKVPPSGPDWIHEIKRDGFRIMVRQAHMHVEPTSVYSDAVTRIF
jgi:hypothetical protein